MIKKKITILIVFYLLTLLLVGCGKDDKRSDAGKNTTEHQTQQQTTTANKTTEEKVTATESITATTESIESLQIGSKENPLQFGNVVTVHKEYMPNPTDIYDVEVEISITDYNNEYISCDVKLINSTPFDNSLDNADIYFDCNFLYFMLYDENYMLIDISSPVNSADGFTQGESNKLIKNQVIKCQVGPLTGSYEGAIPKYIAFEYGGEYTEQSYLPYYVYYEIPDGLFDTSYKYVDMSVLGADSAEQALELFFEAINNNDADIAKKISFYYYIFYEKKDRVVLEDWNEMDYLRIDYKSLEFFREQINQEQEPEEYIYGIDFIRMLEGEINDESGYGYVQAGYEYAYDYINEYGETRTEVIQIIMCDDRWFVIYDLPI